MTSVSEFTASRIDCRKNFSNPSRMSGVTGVWRTLSALSLFSRADERTGSYTGRDSTGERSYVSARHETRSLSRCDSRARVRLPCTEEVGAGKWRHPVARSASDPNAALDLFRLSANEDAMSLATRPCRSATSPCRRPAHRRE